MKTVKLTLAQALFRFLMRQYSERDDQEQPFFAGCFGIFGHGNIAGVGQALQQYPEFKYYLARNEQALVHTAAAYAKMKNRLQTFVCTSSIGPGATNMITGAAAATINRLPVLLLPGDIFANRSVSPVLQQLEHPHSQDISVNDCFKPVSRYWDRLYRPEQLISALPEAMRVLASPAETGAVTLCLPQDVQAEAFDYPASLFEKRVWSIRRPTPDAALLEKAIHWIQASKKPLIIAGGGVIYSEASEALQSFAAQTGIPVAETQAGKGSLPFDHPLCLSAIGVTGTEAANLLAKEADLIIGIGTRYSDFTTASKTAFQNENVRFININIAEIDSFKHAALPLTADARAALSQLQQALEAKPFAVDPAYREKAARLNRAWAEEVRRIYDSDHDYPAAQGAVIGAVNDFGDPQDVVVCAAGSLPGDLHKLWQTRSPKGYHLEYGYSTMGYEIAGGLGVKMADPQREVYVMVGDGSYLMMAQEIITSIQEGVKLTIILLNNHGFGSIGGLSEALGSGGFGTRYRYRNPASGQLNGERLPVDFAANARSMGAFVIEAKDITGLKSALREAKKQSKTTVIVIETDREKRVGGYHSWWDVPVAEISESAVVQKAHRDYKIQKQQKRYFL